MNRKTARKKMLKALDKFDKDIREQRNWVLFYGISRPNLMEILPLISHDDWAAWAAVLDLDVLLPEYEALRDVVLAEHVASATAKFKARAGDVQHLREYVLAYENTLSAAKNLTYYNNTYQRISFPEIPERSK